MADTDSILQLGIEAARGGDKAEARELFRLVTREDPDNAQAWLWLAGVAQDRDEKRVALERVIALDPDNDLARKGLTALGGPRPTVPVDVPASPTALPEPAAPEQAPELAAAVEATTPASVASDVGADSTPDTGGARSYEAPTDAPVALTDEPPAAEGWTAPTFDADEYDLQDYQQPTATAESAVPTGGTRVVVEGEEPVRRRPAWLPFALAAAALVLLLTIAGVVLANRSSTRGEDVAGASATTPAGSDALAGGEQDRNLQVVETEVAGSEAAATTPAAETSPKSVPAETLITPEAAAAPGETPPATEATTAPIEPAPTDATGTDSEETIVVVPPGATVAPIAEVGAETVAPAPEAAPAPAATEVTATEVPATPPPAPAPAGDVAAANPAIVPNDTQVQAGAWSFTYSGLKNVATGAYGGSTPTRGQYQIVLLAVANNGDQPATIPDGFLVLKDGQGRVYDFNRAASVEYFTRFGGAGQVADVAPDAQIPNNAGLTSVPLLFDVPPDATNLVLFSRDNLAQGFLIR